MDTLGFDPRERRPARLSSAIIIFSYKKEFTYGGIMRINKGYLTAKTDKASDEYYTPREAVIPILK